MSNLKKVLALVMALAMVMTVFASASIKTVLNVKDADKFTEAQLDAAGQLQGLGVLAGTGADELGSGNVTRAQMVAFIYRLMNGGDEGVDAYYTKSAKFSDVDTEAWYAPYINWAYASKVAAGYPDGTFAPEAEVTGADAAAFLVRLLGKDASGSDYALKAQAAATTLQLDHGIATKGLYENALCRGDMFILLANTLTSTLSNGKSFAEIYFDLEVIPGAVLVGSGKIGANGYTVFQFRTSTSNDVKTFKTDVLCVEEGFDLTTDIGCKYTLYVSKTQDAQGFRTLFAAIEEGQSKWYSVKEGLVNDGALIFSGNKQNVKFASDVSVYVDGKAATVADFLACYGKKNTAAYKLIDNDGDGEYEYAFIERMQYKGLGVETISAKVTAIAANGKITVTADDGTVYSGLTFGEYWNGKDAWVDPTAAAKKTLGISDGFNKYVGISDTFYSFDIVANADKTSGYIYNVGISEKTAFAGNYGIFVEWNHEYNLYKNMGYATFVNENNEYFNAYVAEINNAADVNYWANCNFDNKLIYFTDGDYSDGIVSFYTADFWDANQTYNYKEAFDWTYGGAKTVEFKDSVWSKISAKETVDYSAEDAVYAVFSKAGSYKIWNTWDAAYETITVDTLYDKSFNRALEGFALLDYAELEGKYIYKVADAKEFYGIEDLAECIGFIYRTNAKVDFAYDFGTAAADSFKIYKANGFWHLRFFTDNSEIDADDVALSFVFNGKAYPLQSKDGKWFIDLGDGNDPKGADDAKVEEIRLAQLVKGFDDAAFTAEVAKLAPSLKNTAYTLIDTTKGVIFAYGKIVKDGAERWVAYDADSFDSSKFSFNTDAQGDEIIYTVAGGKTYVKAMKIVATTNDILPYGWLKNAGYELVIFNGFTGAVNTEGWEIDVLTLTAEGIKSEKAYTLIGLGGAVAGDVLLVKKDENGAYVSIENIAKWTSTYIPYAIGAAASEIKQGKLNSAFSFNGEDANGNYQEYSINVEGKNVYYLTEKDGFYTYTSTYNKDTMEGHNCIVYGAGNNIFVIVK